MERRAYSARWFDTFWEGLEMVTCHRLRQLHGPVLPALRVFAAAGRGRGHDLATFNLRIRPFGKHVLEVPFRLLGARP
jgi:hypothetical protein